MTNGDVELHVTNRGGAITEAVLLNHTVDNGRRVVLSHVDADIPRSEEPEAIIVEILEGAGPDVEVEPDWRQAIARAVELAQEGDVVVIAGKGHEQGQEFRDRTLPFDDREVAREALRRLGAAA